MEEKRPKRRKRTHLSLNQSRQKNRKTINLHNMPSAELEQDVDTTLLVENSANVTPRTSSAKKRRNESEDKNATPNCTVSTTVSTTKKRKLMNAPTKSRKRRIVFSKKSLQFGFEFKSLSEKRICELSEELVNVLSAAKILPEFMQLIEQLVNNTFPVTNIALLLCLERAKLQALNTTTNMTYSKETLVFWKVVYRLYGGGAIRLFSGPKHIGNFSKGYLEPQEGMCNFAVPDLKTLRNADSVNPVPKKVEPGIINQVIDVMAKRNDKEFVLAVDGKKIAQGLTKDAGDIDLWGFEEPKLVEQKERLVREINICNSLTTFVSEHNLTDDTLLVDIDQNLRGNIHEHLKDVAKTTTKRIQDMRDVSLKQTFLAQKLEKMSTENPALKDKYKFAINKTKAALHQCHTVIKKALMLNREICRVGSVLCRDNNYSGKSIVEINEQANIVQLQEPDKLPESLRASSFIKQHSQEWHDLRKLAPTTGSTLHTAIGLRTLKEQKEHIKAFKGEYIKEISPELQELFDHGNRNEPNAICTIAAQVLPFVVPNCKYFEEGAHFISSKSNRLVIEVSPDGAIKDSNKNIVYSLEVKCPFPRSFKLPVFYTLPQYYVLQVMAEMVAQDCQRALFVSYSKESTTVMRVLFDLELWNEVMSAVERTYDTEEILLPSKLSNTVHIKELITKFIKTNVELLIEVPSQIASPSVDIGNLTIAPPYMYAARVPDVPVIARISDVSAICDDAEQVIEEGNLICRKKSSEILAFILTDTDRMSNPEYPHHLPIAYGLKGYSLTSITLRQMCEAVKEKCFINGLSILCESFDGQWHSLTVRDIEGNPLTRLELQKDIWKEACGMSKSSQLALLKKLFKVSSDDPLIGIDIDYEGDKQRYSIASLDRKLKDIITPKDPKLWVPKSVRNRNKQSVSNSVQSVQQDTPEVSNIELVTGNELPDEIITALQSNDMIYEEPLPEIINDGVETDELQVESNIQGTNITFTDINENTAVTNKVTLTENDFLKIKHFFSSSYKTKWEKKLSKINLLVFTSYFNANVINKKFTRQELIDIVNQLYHYPAISKINIDTKKCDLVKSLNAILGDHLLQDITVKSHSQKKVPTLKVLSYKILSAKAYPKTVLNVIVATYISPERVTEWENNSPVAMTVNIDGRMEKMFSFPEFCINHKKLEPKVIDPSHLIVNNRSRLLEKGVMNLKPDEFARVCLTHPQVINRALVVDIVDKQNVSLALKVFSEEVEHALHSNGAHAEAYYASKIRNWYAAIDQPGIPALDRINKMLDFKQYLLEGVNFHKFPPPGMFINNMSVVQFSGFVQNTDTRIQMYTISKAKTYNQRAIGTLAAESFFSDLTEMDATGCPKAVNIPSMMSHVSEINNFRHDSQSRVFYMVTKRTSVYPCKQLDGSEFVKCNEPESSPIREPTDVPISTNITGASPSIEYLTPRNHFFDSTERKKKKRRVRHSNISLPHEPSRGERPIRALRFKKDESKILATTRLNIDENLI